MSEPVEPMPGHEPSLHTVEMVCERLAEMGVTVGLDTARELVRAVLAAEAPRVDARLREALDTTLQTIRVAAQAAMGVLATTTPAEPGEREARRAAAPPPRSAPAPKPAAPPAPPPRHPPAPRRTPPVGRPAVRQRPEDADEPTPPPEPRPIFRRPRGR